jgi:antitoxin MazE
MRGDCKMRASIIKIGNSQGIRLPKPLLDQTGIKDDVELEVEKSQIIIRPISNLRDGWDEAFKSMSQNRDDTLLDGNEVIANSFDEEEWQWK